MDSLQIRSGRIKLQILDDSGEERGIFSFNPNDIESAKRVVEVQKEFEIKNKEFQIKSKECTTTEEKIKLLDEVVLYFRELIDNCFGEGSSQILFGDEKSIDMFYDFFEGITPYYEKASEDRMAKYMQPNK